MVAQLLGLLSLCLLVSLLASPTNAATDLNIKYTGEVTYSDRHVYGVLDRGVILECGNELPDLYIWSFTKPGTQNIRAIVYDIKKGPRIQKFAHTLGDLSVISHSAAIGIGRLPLVAQGLYTCQAFFDRPEGIRAYYYFIQLTVRVPISKPYVVQSGGIPVEGLSLWLRCGHDNGTGPINYMWQHETPNGGVTDFTWSNSSMLNMTAVNRNHSGSFRCRARNPVNSLLSEPIWLNIFFGPDVPQIDVTPYSVTERGFSALERQTVSLLCQTRSNPPSEYVWFYNSSQVYTGPQYTITKILRMHTGNYACLAKNIYLNTMHSSKKTISLTVYYAPDGMPTCSVEPALNYTSVSMPCSWPGGLPSASLQWTGGLLGLGQNEAQLEMTNKLTSNASLLLSGAQISNNTLFTCLGSHRALNHTTTCSARTYSPPGEPVCFAYATRNNKLLMLSCTWYGGVPRALLWWEGPGGQGQPGVENSNILVLRYGTAHSGLPYACHAKHPLLAQVKTCKLTLEAPVLMTQRSVVSVYEGSDVKLTCILRDNYLPSNDIIWFNNHRQEVWDTSKKYLLQRAAAWANLTVREADEMQDSGQYWCSASNAVGGAEIPVTLRVMRYPMPPNVTLVKVMYSSGQRKEVEMEWLIEGENEDGSQQQRWGFTGFILEQRWVAERPLRQVNNDSTERGKMEESAESRKGSSAWLRFEMADPETRAHILGSLAPTTKYQFRIRAVNHRTIGHPSEAKTPADPPFNQYPAVIGAAIGGMIFAAFLTLLLLLLIIRRRHNNPRLHDLLFGRSLSQSRENISYPEDEGAEGFEGGIEDLGPSATAGPPTMAPPTMALPRAASPSAPSPIAVTPMSATATPGQAPPPGDDNEPVNVTISVMATGS